MNNIELQERLSGLRNAQTMMRGERYIAREGRLWRIRFMADPKDPYWDSTTFERGIRPFVGTVAAVDPPHFYKFPPSSVLEELPGYVGARYTEDFRVVFTSMPDRVTENGIIYSGQHWRIVHEVTELEAIDAKRRGRTIEEF